MIASLDGLTTSWSAAWNQDPKATEEILTETADLGWAYVSRLSFDRAPADILDRLATLGEKDARFLRLLRFVASKEVREFLFEVVPRLIRRLPQAFQSNRTVAREVRGRVDWSATARERRARGNDPTIFVLSRAERNFDTAENQALAFLLDRVAEIAAEISIRPNGQIHRGRDDVANLGREAVRLRRVSGLSTVRTLTHVDGRIRQALRAARLPEFRDQVAVLLDLYDALVLAGDMKPLRALVGERIWLPKEPERIFELWSLFGIATSLERAGWKTTRMRLIGSRSEPGAAFVLVRDGARVSLHYQSAPPGMLTGGRYTPLLKAYGISGGPRRPDIVVTVEGENGPSILLVEVKLTSDRRYLVDAIYKVFGYLVDFADSIGSAPPTRAALVVWGGLEATRPPITADEVAIFDVAAIRNGAIVALVDALAHRPAM